MSIFIWYSFTIWHICLISWLIRRIKITFTSLITNVSRWDFHVWWWFVSHESLSYILWFFQLISLTKSDFASCGWSRITPYLANIFLLFLFKLFLFFIHLVKVFYLNILHYDAFGDCNTLGGINFLLKHLLICNQFKFLRQAIKDMEHTKWVKENATSMKQHIDSTCIRLN